MAFEEEFSNVQVLYQLSWEGKMEHPHMITVQYPSHQDGLRLRGKFRDVFIEAVYTPCRHKSGCGLCIISRSIIQLW